MCPKCQEQSLPSIGDSTENYRGIKSHVFKSKEKKWCLVLLELNIKT